MKNQIDNLVGARKMNHKRIPSLAAAICIVLIQVSAFLVQEAQSYETRNAPYYDPEAQDGIPVISAKSLAPEMQWRYQDHRGDESLPRRRSSDPDLEDAGEDDDDDERDEYSKAGSTNHDSYENPAFGESRRAARDGDDIENFFDKHLGPPQDASDGDNTGIEVPINEVATRPASGDYDDHYEAAASSPLSNIFHSIISAHKRPLVITTTDDSSSSSTDSSSTLKDNNQQAASSTSTVRGYNGIDGPQPIAYFTTQIAAAPSTNYNNQQQPEEDGGVREIIIARRPVSYINQLHSPTSLGGRMVHQSSNDNWRGQLAPSRYPSAHDDGEYSRYPVAASYSYQQEQQAAQPEEEQTVSYGLSFGRSNDDDSSSSADDQSSVDEPAPSYPQYSRTNPMRHSSSMMNRQYNNNYLQYNQHPSLMHPVLMGYGRQQYQQFGVPMMQQQQQQQQPFNGARYHKDPSESVAQPVSYAQYSQKSSNMLPMAENNNDWLHRQQLLANLDHQLKKTQYYRQQQNIEPASAQQSLTRYLHRSNDKNKQSVNRFKPDGDVDTYSSYHSEVDPYKSFTTSSRIISEPAANNNRIPLTEAYRAPISPNMEAYRRLRENRFTDGSPSLSQQGSSLNSTFNDNYNTSNTVNHQRDNLITGPVLAASDKQTFNDLLRNKQLDITSQQQQQQQQQVVNSRKRRDDSDERESDDADDDGVWVDDDDDDDNRQQSSDLNETAQEPDEEDSQQDEVVDNRTVSPPGIIGGHHGYDITPDDLMVYQG